MGEKFYDKTWFIILMFLFFPPIGAFLFFKNWDRWGTVAKILVGIYSAIILFGFFSAMMR